MKTIPLKPERQAELEEFALRSGKPPIEIKRELSQRRFDVDFRSERAEDGTLFRDFGSMEVSDCGFLLSPALRSHITILRRRCASSFP